MKTPNDRYPDWITEQPSRKDVLASHKAIVRNVKRTLKQTAETEEDVIVARLINPEKLSANIEGRHNTPEGSILSLCIRFNTHLRHKFDSDRVIRKPVILTTEQTVSAINTLLPDFKGIAAKALVLDFADDWYRLYKKTDSKEEPDIIGKIEKSFPGKLQKIYQQIRTGTLGTTEIDRDAA